MRHWAVFIVVVLLTLVTGYSTYERKATVNSQFCTLYKTLVLQIDKGVASVPLAEARHDKAGYNRGYAFDIQLEKTLEHNSPCVIIHTIPPNILQVAEQAGVPTTTTDSGKTQTTTSTSSTTTTAAPSQHTSAAP